MSRFLSVIAMTVMVASGASTAALAQSDGNQPTDEGALAENALPFAAPATEFSLDAQRLLGTYPDGGEALEEALVALIEAQPDRAASVSELISLLGTRPTAGQIAATGNAVRRAANYTVKEFQQAIAQLVIAADDPVVMAMNALAIAPYLDDEMQGALGVGLARAASSLKESGKAAIAGVIDAEIASAKDSPLQQAYMAARGEDVFPTRGPAESQTKTRTKDPLNPPDDFEPQTGSPS